MIGHRTSPKILLSLASRLCAIVFLFFAKRSLAYRSSVRMFVPSSLRSTVKDTNDYCRHFLLTGMSFPPLWSLMLMLISQIDRDLSACIDNYTSLYARFSLFYIGSSIFVKNLSLFHIITGFAVASIRNSEIITSASNNKTNLVYMLARI